jgi:uncharacterized protein HemX
VTYDETWDAGPDHRVPVAALAALAALLALAVSAFVFVRQTGAVDAERAARNAEVNGLARRIEALEERNSTLSGRLGSAEKTLKRRETGIARWRRGCSGACSPSRPRTGSAAASSPGATVARAFS